MSAPDFGDQIESEKLSEIKLSLKVSKSQKKYVVLDSPKKTPKAGAFLCTEKCPSVHFLGESRTTNFFF